MMRVNRLEPGSNYGWPEVTGAAADSRFLDPLLSLTPTVAIAGAAFYSQGRLPQSWEGNFLFTALKGAHLQRVVHGAARLSLGSVPGDSL